jgi:hypothetical protein
MKHTIASLMKLINDHAPSNRQLSTVITGYGFGLRQSNGVALITEATEARYLAALDQFAAGVMNHHNELKAAGKR